MPETYLPSYEEVSDTIRLHTDGVDPWGTAMGAMFAVAETLYRGGFEVPAEYGYRPAPGIAVGDAPGPDDDMLTCALYEIVDADSRADGALLYWLRILDKYRALCVLAGRDY